MASDYVMGLDLGQTMDYTALCVVRRVRVPKVVPVDMFGKAQWDKVTYEYHVPRLERFELGTPYPDMVKCVTELLESLSAGTRLVVDASGVGKAVVDLFRAAGLSPIAVTITGGDQQHCEQGRWSVPKRDLVGQLQVLLHARRLKVLDSLKLAPILKRELLNFRMKPSAKTAQDTYEAREGEHDDLLLAAALAAWWALKWGEPKGDGNPVVHDRGGFR